MFSKNSLNFSLFYILSAFFYVGLIFISHPVVAKFKINPPQLQVQQVQGDLIYETYDAGGRSVLKFPLDNKMAGLQVDGELPSPFYDPTAHDPRLFFGMKALLAENDAYAGVGTDADYIPADGHTGVDTYSTARTELERGGIADAWLGALIEDNPNFAWTFQVGIRYEEFRFENSEIDQIDYRTGDTVYESSVALTYKRKSWYPYFGVRFYSPREQTLGWHAYFKYSDFLYVEDEDNHLLRDLLFKGDLDKGRAMLGGAGIDWRPVDSLLVSLDIKYNDYTADGTQTQIDYAANNVLGTTNETIDDEKTYYNFALRYLW